MEKLPNQEEAQQTTNTIVTPAVDHVDSAVQSVQQAASTAPVEADDRVHGTLSRIEEVLKEVRDELKKTSVAASETADVGEPAIEVVKQEPRILRRNGRKVQRA